MIPATGASPGATPADDVRIVLTSFGDRPQAERIARQLIEERLAACVNLLPQVCSIYRWRGAVEQADEVLALIKTSRAAEAALFARIRQLHPYEVPEMLSLSPVAGWPDYLNWVISEST